MNPIIQTSSLSKQYKEVLAADAVDLQVNKGEIYGFLGLNGAGKTTTIRMLLGMIKPTSGSAFLFGERVGHDSTNLWNRVGQMVEVPSAYPELTVLENLEIFRKMRSIKDKSSIDDIIDSLFLDRYKNIKAKNLSMGNKQRLGIAKAMLHKPELLILDEPANGLDPAGIVQIRGMLANLANNEGVTIFVSSHILGEISKLATRIGIIHHGKLIRESETEELKNSRTRLLHVNTMDNKRAIEILAENGFQDCKQLEGSIEISDETALQSPEKITELLVNKGVPPSRISLDEEDLEHYFFRIIQNHH